MGLVSGGLYWKYKEKGSVASMQAHKRVFVGGSCLSVPVLISNITFFSPSSCYPPTSATPKTKQAYPRNTSFFLEPNKREIESAGVD